MNLDNRLQKAVASFWTERANQLQRQIAGGRIDMGSRGAVTGGHHMRAFEALVTDLLVDAGLKRADVRSRSAIELPGYYRPEKKWDLVAVSEGQLVAVVEFKSMVGSVGKNINNRVEEAIGNAADIWVAFREGRFGSSTPPFLGYFFLLQDEPTVHRESRRFQEPYFEVDPIFRGSTYAKRYEIMCRRFVLERLYSGATLIFSTPDAEITQPAEDLSFQRFAAGLRGHVVTSIDSRSTSDTGEPAPESSPAPGTSETRSNRRRARRTL